MIAKKQKGKKVQLVKDQIKSGRSREHGFLHIPKTGGSGVNTFGRSLQERGFKSPCVFSHGWKIEEILNHFPNIKISFVLRDPLSRMISGFNSRIRQGRPTYNNLWTPAEAAAFSLFPSVGKLLDAILAEDEFSKSAVRYTMRHVTHLRWNYSFYFKNLDTVRSNRSSFEIIGSMNRMDEFINSYTALSGAPESTAAELYEKRHEAKVRSEDSLERYSPEDVSRLKGFIDKDYRIYNELLSIANLSPS